MVATKLMSAVFWDTLVSIDNVTTFVRILGSFSLNIGILTKCDACDSNRTG